MPADRGHYLVLGPQDRMETLEQQLAHLPPGAHV